MSTRRADKLLDAFGSVAGSAPMLQGLGAIEDAEAQALILGSMPGNESLRLQQYYAHPRNDFWPIMGELFGAGLQLPYSERLAVLRRRGVAVWDVLEACQRRGSLDTSIDPASLRVNDFATFFAAHPRLRRIVFNGSFAEATFRTRVQLGGARLPEDVALLRLPSTSPANASVPYSAKLAAWRAALLPAAR